MAARRRKQEDELAALQLERDELRIQLEEISASIGTASVDFCQASSPSQYAPAAPPPPPAAPNATPDAENSMPTKQRHPVRYDSIYKHVLKQGVEASVEAQKQNVHCAASVESHAQSGVTSDGGGSMTKGPMRFTLDARSPSPPALHPRNQSPPSRAAQLSQMRRARKGSRKDSRFASPGGHLHTGDKGPQSYTATGFAVGLGLAKPEDTAKAGLVSGLDLPLGKADTARTAPTKLAGTARAQVQNGERSTAKTRKELAYERNRVLLGAPLPNDYRILHGSIGHLGAQEKKRKQEAQRRARKKATDSLQRRQKRWVQQQMRKKQQVQRSATDRDNEHEALDDSHPKHRSMLHWDAPQDELLCITQSRRVALFPGKHTNMDSEHWFG